MLTSILNFQKCQTPDLNEKIKDKKLKYQKLADRALIYLKNQIKL